MTRLRLGITRIKYSQQAWSWVKNIYKYVQWPLGTLAERYLVLVRESMDKKKPVQGCSKRDLWVPGHSHSQPCLRSIYIYTVVSQVQVTMYNVHKRGGVYWGDPWEGALE